MISVPAASQWSQATRAAIAKRKAEAQAKAQAEAEAEAAKAMRPEGENFPHFLGEVGFYFLDLTFLSREFQFYHGCPIYRNYACVWSAVDNVAV